MTRTMRGVQIRRYGAASEVLELVDDLPIPALGADEILVHTHATAVNPVDCTARNGYGRQFFRTLWGELPLVLGRDVSGTVIEVGDQVARFAPGDEVYAAPHIGCYAEYVPVKAAHAALKPRNLSHLEAASLPFVALTAWTALVEHAGLSPGNCRDRKIVVPRAAGGVGTFAVQLMKAWGAHVSALCSARNVEFVRSLGADEVIDYEREDFTRRLRNQDVALDTIGRPGDFDAMEATPYNAGSAEDFDQKLLDVLATHRDAVFVTICTPKMVLTDLYGLEEGLRRSDDVFRERAEAQRALGRRYHWSFFNPDGAALSEIAGLVESGAIRPMVDRVFPLDEMAEAHRYCESGRARGKIVIEVGDTPTDDRMARHVDSIQEEGQ